MSDIGALIAWLLAVPRDQPVEDCGATAAFAAISGTEITAVMQSRGPRELTQREQRQLQALSFTPSTHPCTWGQTGPSATGIIVFPAGGPVPDTAPTVNPAPARHSEQPTHGHTTPRA